MSDYLNRNKDKLIVARHVKIDIEQHFPEVGGISLSTVTRLLKQKLLFSYKKLSKRSIINDKKTNTTKIVKVCSII